MPFKSKKQQRFLEAHPDKVGGKAKLKEWESKTDFKHLPESAKPRPRLVDQFAAKAKEKKNSDGK